MKYSWAQNAGVYTLKVAGSRYDIASLLKYNSGPYSFILPFEEAIFTDVELNNEISETNLLLNGETKRGLIALDGTEDFYKVTVSMAGAAKFTVCSYKDYYIIFLYNSQGKKLKTVEK